MSVETRANFVRAIADKGYVWAMERYDEEDTTYDEVFDVGTSDGAYEQFTTALGPSRLTQTPEATAIPRTTATEGFTVHCANKKFAIELPISNEAIDDNRQVENFLKSWAEELGEAARATKEEHHANFFNKGGFTAGHSVFLQDIPNVLTTTYGQLGYDSIPFFAASGNNHTAKNNSTYYNGVVTLDLDETNLQTLWKLMTVTNAYNEAGRKISIIPNVLVVQLGSDNWFTANRIVMSPAPVSAAHSGVENLWKGRLRVVGWPYLTDPDAWFIGRAKKGLKSLARLPLAIDFYEEKSVDAQVVRARVRFGANETNWRYWAGANFSQS